jgi:hypothetical protein
MEISLIEPDVFLSFLYFLAFFLFRAADNIDRYAATPSPNHFRAYVAIS